MDRLIRSARNLHASLPPALELVAGAASIIAAVITSAALLSLDGVVILLAGSLLGAHILAALLIP